MPLAFVGTRPRITKALCSDMKMASFTCTTRKSTSDQVVLGIGSLKPKKNAIGTRCQRLTLQLVLRGEESEQKEDVTLRRPCPIELGIWVD